MVGGCARVPPPDTTPPAAATTMPPGIRIDDDLTEDEAVAIALWNNPEFQLQITQLGFARADLLEAGLLRNPVLSLLFPVGPKQFEATLKAPIEILWERPRRVAVARTSIERVGASLEQYGLDLVSAVRIAHIDLVLARSRAQLAAQTASELDDINRLTAARLAAGDISALEARSAAIDAARARQDASRAQFDIRLRQNDLQARLGLALDEVRLTVPAAAIASQPCAAMPALLTEALASRPDVRASELAIDEAGRRLGWERSRILAVTAVLDANGSGSEGFELGPGVELGLPLFDRNQAARARGTAELERAGRAYLATRQRVATELREASTQLEQANATLDEWRTSVLTPLEEQVRSAERAYGAGDVSYLFVLDMTRRLTDARLRLREAEADRARALVRTERAAGRRCLAAGQEITRGF